MNSWLLRAPVRTALALLNNHYLPLFLFSGAEASFCMFTERNSEMAQSTLGKKSA